jgi:hypothetical protein
MSHESHRSRAEVTLDARLETRARRSLGDGDEPARRSEARGAPAWGAVPSFVRVAPGDATEVTVDETSAGPSVSKRALAIDDL